MQRMTRDDGSVAAIVVVMLSFGMLLGLGAIVMDFGAQHAERRQLQNGADAAVLALAQDCAVDATTCDTSEAAAEPWVSDNNDTTDGVGSVFDVCVASAGVLGPCNGSFTAGTITDCLDPDPAEQANWSGFLEVRTETQEVTQLMGQVFGGAPQGAGACARAAWGSVGGLSTIPLTISYCEWLSMTADGTDFAPAAEPDGGYPLGYPTSYERRLHTHQGASGSAAGTCDPGGAYSDMPGGFGWLNPDGAECEAYYEAGEDPTADTGANIPAECRNDIASLVGTTVFLPIFTAASDPPDRAYTIEGFAGFYMTGYGRIPNASPNRVASIASGTHLCTGSEHCVYGWFTQALVPDAVIGGGGDFGLTTSQLTG